MKCSFDEFVREKVVSPSYSSAILGLPLLYNIVLVSAIYQHKSTVGMQVFDELLSINVPWSQEFSGVFRIWT